MRRSYIYIITNKNRTVFYTGVTADLNRRMQEHRAGVGSTFCRKYKVYVLIHYEVFLDIKDAIRREKEIKGWRRAKKLELVRRKNPGLDELLGR